MYYILLPDLVRRTAAIEMLKSAEINSVFHYIPLHSAPAGKKFARAHGEMMVTDDIADRLLRLPLWAGLEDRQVEVIQAVLAVL
jgi:dTDP-4-amino-4,6-dideoxygalactose transaminase